MAKGRLLKEGLKAREPAVCSCVVHILKPLLLHPFCGHSTAIPAAAKQIIRLGFVKRCYRRLKATAQPIHNSGTRQRTRLHFPWGTTINHFAAGVSQGQLDILKRTFTLGFKTEHVCLFFARWQALKLPNVSQVAQALFPAGINHSNCPTNLWTAADNSTRPARIPLQLGQWACPIPRSIEAKSIRQIHGIRF